MGMYDYLGNSGDQVKCFYVPCITIHLNKDTKQYDVNLYASGGRLKGYNKVPYQTPYYNYGKDFIVVEYRFEENPYIHMVKNGRYFNTYTISDLDETFELPPVAIDNYGDKLNIATVADLKEFVEDFGDKWALYEMMQIQYLSEYNLSYKLDMNRMKKMSVEELRAEQKIRDEIHSKVFNKTMKLFNEKWFQNEDEDMIGLGLALDDYKELIIRKNPDRYQRHEYEWYLIFDKAIQPLRARFDNPIEAYWQWCKQKGIKLTKKWVINILETYTKPAPEALEIDYRKKKGEN